MKTRWGILLGSVYFAGAIFAASPSERSPIGTNLDGLDYWSTELPFVDAFKTASPWFSGTADLWEDQRSLDLDEHGWVRSLMPGQIAKSIMFWYDHPRYPAGQYLVQYEGDGTIEYYFEFQGARVVKRSPGRDVIEIDSSPSGGIGLFLTSVNPVNYIRNIRVIMPVQAKPEETFNPSFIERNRNYKALRFMIWMLGSDAPNHALVPHTWSKRPKREDAHWSGTQGAPVEVMVELANRLKAHPWFTIPHLADDDYVRHFAELVRDMLDPSLKVYVEHSNEVWNQDYPQRDYAQKRGLALGLSTEPGEAGLRYHARRTKEIGTIFKSVLGAKRVVTVLAMFTEMPELSEQVLNYNDTAAHVDALAIAPYFGYEIGLPENESRVQRLTKDELLKEIETIWIPKAIEYTVKQAEIARRYRLPVIAYEGGQHLLGISPVEKNKRVNALFDAANRDPRMGLLYTRYLESWSRVTGGQLFVHLLDCGGYGEHGRWGSLEYIDQPRSQAPKYDAIQRWIEGK